MEELNDFFEPELNTRDEVFDLISWWKKDKVRNAKIMVIGAGALGNEVLKNLALLNVGNILIVDYDTIEFSNLSRSLLFREKDATASSLKSFTAAERVKDLNPEVKVMAMNADINFELGLGIYRRMDAIVGCLDNRLARMSINRSCYKVNKPWVEGAIENLAGQAVVFVPGVSCYECELSDREKQMIAKAMGCIAVANRSIVRGRIPTTPISASIIGAFQAQEALKLIHNYDENTTETLFKTLKNTKFRFDGKTLDTGFYKMEEIQEDCMSHEHYDNIMEVKELSCNMTVRQLLDWIKENLKENEPQIGLPQQFIYEVGSKNSEKKLHIMLTENKLKDYMEKNEELFDPDDVYYQKGINVIDNAFPFMDLTLRQIGIPALDIVKVDTLEGYKYIELTGDENILSFS